MTLYRLDEIEFVLKHRGIPFECTCETSDSMDTLRRRHTWSFRVAGVLVARSPSLDELEREVNHWWCGSDTGSKESSERI